MWKSAAFSQFPTPALREWGAFPLRSAMREAFFKPLIESVETRIQNQQKENWDRSIFENQLMGYSMRTDRYHIVLWKDRSNLINKPIFVELYDHETDPEERYYIAGENAILVNKLIEQFDSGWEGNLPGSF